MRCSNSGMAYALSMKGIVGRHAGTLLALDLHVAHRS